MEEDLYLLERIRKALFFLRREHGKTQEKVIDEINAKNKRPEKFRDTDNVLSASTVSSYKKATIFANGLNSAKAFQIVKMLEGYIETTFEYMWSPSEKRYVSIKEEDLKKHKDKLEALIDTWEAYTWDSEASKLKQEGFIHCFRLKIESPEKVICSTKDTPEFTGKMFLIGIDKVCIEIFHATRKAFFILHFGSAEASNIKNTKIFFLVYVDSGRFTSRCGKLAIRRTDRTYEDIICESFPALELESLWHGLSQDLCEKQFILEH